MFKFFGSMIALGTIVLGGVASAGGLNGTFKGESHQTLRIYRRLLPAVHLKDTVEWSLSEQGDILTIRAKSRGARPTQGAFNEGFASVHAGMIDDRPVDTTFDAKIVGDVTREGTRRVVAQFASGPLTGTLHLTQRASGPLEVTQTASLEVPAARGWFGRLLRGSHVTAKTQVALDPVSP